MNTKRLIEISNTIEALEKERWKIEYEKRKQVTYTEDNKCIYGCKVTDK